MLDPGGLAEGSKMYSSWWPGGGGGTGAWGGAWGKCWFSDGWSQVPDQWCWALGTWAGASLLGGGWGSWLRGPGISGLALGGLCSAVADLGATVVLGLVGAQGSGGWVLGSLAAGP